MYIKYVFALIFIALVARFVLLDYVPPHLSNDEIGSAYAAYSISKTLKDGTGEYLPILWRSHGGYGAPLAVYIPLINISLLGNDDFAVSLPSAILGSLTVVLVGLLVMELTKNRKLAIVTSFLLAFSPWHFSASRWALESNYALFFVVLGIYLFFLGLRYSKDWLTLLSFISFALSIYSYYTEWVLTPMIILALLVFNREAVFKKKIYLGALLLFSILITPIFLDFISNLSSSRANSEFITKDIGVGRLLSEYSNPYQRFQIILKAVLDKYSLYTSLDYQFFYGARMLPKENPYQFGFFLAPFLVAFVWGLSKLKTLYQGNSKFVFFLLIASPLTASVTQGEVNNWRSLPQLVPTVMITAVGILYILNFVKKSIWLKALGGGLVLLSFFYFVLAYFIYFPIENAQGYQYGYKQIAQYINQHYDQFEQIIIDRRFGEKEYYYIGVPSSYIPFYTYLDPRKVQEAKIISFGITFDKYQFRDINWDNEKIQKNYLYVVPHDNIPDPARNLKVVHEISLPNHKIGFKLYSPVN